MTVNVPFRLLNLTLTALLMTTPTQYFPCRAETKYDHRLGRAFLQAAFVGVNWMAYDGKAAWFLAQAPDPTFQVNLRTDKTQASSTNLPTSPDTSASASSTPSASSNPISPVVTSGMSIGAKAGVGVGTTVGVLFVLLVASSLWRHERSKKLKLSTPPDYELTKTDANGIANGHRPFKDDADAMSPNSQSTGSTHQVHEAPTNFGERYKVPG
ncbi:hypothetical protein BGZ60DRAFT_529454 [Tricladium varicosporioides]|nr:hypothetical protein BGZ60DRAFT_529454 [Hymenoscyphus varicosporioides]